MSIHIGASPGQIADKVLLPGDPLRAKAIADEFLTDVICYNEIRGMLGFTGTYKGKQVSVQGSGMGIPSLSIYVHELFDEYGVKEIIRVGTCGSIQEDLQIGDVIIGLSASSNSNTGKLRFPDGNYAPGASYRLLKSAVEAASDLGVTPTVGNIFSSDLFYHDDPKYWKKWSEYGVLAIEMEASGLYTLAAKFGRDALTILTVSDHIILKQEATADQRQNGFLRMAEIALNT